MKTITAIIFILFLTGCDYINSLKKGEVIIEKKIDAGNFNEICFDVSANIVFHDDTSDVIEVRGVDLNVEKLRIDRDGEKLHVYNEGFKYVRKEKMVTLLIPVPRSLSITVNSPSQISSLDTIHPGNFRMVINGRGTFTETDLLINAGSISVSVYGDNIGNHTLTGRCENLFFNTEGISTVDASGLKAIKVAIDQRSKQPSYVWAVNNLNVKMYSAGDIFYKGKPEINFRKIESRLETQYGGVSPLNN